LIEVEKLSKTFVKGKEKLCVLDELSLSIPDRQFVSILGSSGCGKSTLLRSMAGLQEPSSGSVAIAGKNVTGPPEGAVYIFQEYGRSLFPWLRLDANVRYPIETTLGKSEAIKRASEMIERVGLKGFERHLPRELSGGMQQRAAIARALVTGPNILLMDEPFGALDAQTRHQLEDLLLRIWSSTGCTIAFVTHDIDEAIYLSDRVVVLQSRPSHIAIDLKIDLPRPRDQLSTKEDLRFSAYRRQLFSHFEAA
jgi:NitT/TauT family transport system ATP-binding protein